VKYVLLIYDDPNVWAKVPPEDYPKLYEEYGAIAQLSNTTGGAQLQPASTARSVRVQDGKPIVSDGPFAETKEVLGGFYIVDADSQAEAEEIAARVPSARMGGTVEVRPTVEVPR
jgi:hypothetical protein